MRVRTTLALVLMIWGLAQACLWTSAALAQGCISEELARNDVTLRGNRFPNRRNLSDYVVYFGKEYFWRDLVRLPKEAHWVDAGAGRATALTGAVSENFASVKVRKLTAIGLKKPVGTVESVPGAEFKYLEGRYLEDIPASEIGAADLVTDLYGPFAYSAAPDQILRKYMEILKKDGIAYIFLRTDATTVNSQADGLGKYLNSIVGAKVEWLPERDVGVRGFKLKKISNEFEVPSLKLERFEAGTPEDMVSPADPRRWYRW